MSDSPDQTAITELTKHTLFELVRTYQAFSTYTEVFVGQFDLTPAQFDVIATLGQTSGMNTGEIGERTLITKGTLTGVIDRLEKKGLVQREVPKQDRRSVLVKLTNDGQAVLNRALPAQIADLERRFGQLESSELELLRVLLRRLRQVF
ncbi:MAG: MarR family transcriptional regulator [Stigonema ocellatum SAG 48.90 = DSM 106950]|nr:MarR family transcriptional regulator [Stigonema ocellatum SAG 48.90 = DSM 106950]